jgi:signal transduction histidine kinase
MTSEQDTAKALEACRQTVSKLQMAAPIARLSSGLGHEFNNLMQTTIGALQLLQKLVDAGRSVDTKPFIDSALRAAQSAIAINQQLVNLARAHPSNPQPLDMSLLITGISDLLRQALPRAVDLTTNLAPELWPTRCDPHRAKLAVLDLFFQTLDAMPAGRALVISTRNCDATDQPIPSIGLGGRYVCVEATCSQDPSTHAAHADSEIVEVLHGSALEAAQAFARNIHGVATFERRVGRAVATLYLPWFDAVDAVSSPS